MHSAGQATHPGAGGAPSRPALLQVAAAAGGGRGRSQLCGQPGGQQVAGCISVGLHVRREGCGQGTTDLGGGGPCAPTPRTLTLNPLPYTDVNKNVLQAASNKLGQAKLGQGPTLSSKGALQGRPQPTTTHPTHSHGNPGIWCTACLPQL